MGLKNPMGALRRSALGAFHRRLVSRQDTCPAVSFCFDDFPRTALSEGGAILREFDVHGTFYASMGLMGQSNGLGQFFQADDLHAVVAEGHELASHTFSHVSSRKVPSAAFRDEVRRGRDALRAAAGEAVTSNFAYPFGDVTFAVKRAIGAFMGSCRGIVGGINEATIDLNLLRANSLYGDVSGFAKAQRLIQVNAESGGWLIFYTHDVHRKPSPHGCTPELLKSAVREAARSGARILTVAGALNSVEAC